MPTYLEVAPSAIRPHPNNPRKDLGELTDITASIKEQGVLEPLVVEEIPDAKPKGHHYQLIYGHRRLAGAKAAKAKQVPVIIREAQPLGLQLEAMLVENLQRADLTAVEEGDAYQALLDLPDGDYNQAKIAKRIGRPKKLVSERLRVAKLPESARDRILSGQLSIEDGVALAEFAGDAEALARIESKATAGPWALRSAIDQERERRRVQRERDKLRKETEKAGRPVLASVDALEEAAGDEDLVWSVEDLAENWTYDEWAKVDEDADGFDHAATEQDIDKRADQWARDHVSCPGHAVVIEDRWTGRYCLDGAKHHPDLIPEQLTGDQPVRGTTASTGETETAEEREQREAEQKARAEFELELRAAAHTRRAYVAEVISQPAKDLEGMAKQFLLSEFQYMLRAGGHPGLTVLAEIVLPNATPESLSGPELPGKVKKALEKLNATQLAVLNGIRLCLSGDTALEKPDRWAWGDQNNSSQTYWRKILTGTFGYEWTPAEQKALAEAGDA